MNLVPSIDPQSVEPTKTSLVYVLSRNGYGVFMSPEQARDLAEQRIPTLAENMAAYLSDLLKRGA